MGAQAGLQPATKGPAAVSISLSEGKLEIEPVRVEPKVKRSPWVRELYELYAPARKGLKDVPEEEINKAIDEAVKEVRSRRS